MPKLLRLISVITIIFTLIVNLIAIIYPLNGISLEAISDSFNSYFTPANYVFLIWGLIYLGLIGYCIYLATQEGKNDSDIDNISPLLILTNIANATWIILWQYGHYKLALIVMLILFLALVLIYLELKIGLKKVSLLKFWLVHATFSLYLGWISIATLANIIDVLYSSGFDGLGATPRVVTAILISIITIATLVLIKLRKDVIFSLVIVWALIGIMINYKDIKMIAYVSFIASIFILIWLIYVRLTEKETKEVQKLEGN